MTTFLVFIITLGVLIFVHELGHFFVARRNGIKVDEFGFGFPPRAIGFYKSKKEKKWKVVFSRDHLEMEDTVYSINWIPIGGFVKIKGEDGSSKKDPDSFASKSAWQKVRVLLAGVVMNFILAWILFSVVFIIGAPKEVPEGTEGSRVQIIQINKDSPAASMGIKEGDEVLDVCDATGEKCEKIIAVSQFQNVVSDYKGQKIILKIKRGESELQLEGVPRISPPEGEGWLGVSPAQTAIVSLPFLEAFYQGIVAIFNFVSMFFNVIKDLLIGNSTGVEISGPVRIYSYTGQVAQLGLIYVMNFIAILSLNLGIVNAFPFPALDGGRVLFILVSKLKKKPLTEETEHAVNTIGFVILMTLMAFVTLRDLVSLDILDKLKNIL